MSLTLLGDVVLSLLLTMFADRFGRRRTLLLASLLSVLAGVVFAISDKYYVLLLAAIVGVISPAGSEVGPDRAIEESIIAELADAERLTDVYTWYNTLAIVGTSLGLLTSGLLVDVVRGHGRRTSIQAYRSVFWMYAALGVVKGILALLLSKQCEPQSQIAEPTLEDGTVNHIMNRDIDETAPLLQQDDRAPEDHHAALAAQDEARSKKGFPRFWPFSKESGLIIAILCLLFSVDSFASGVVPYSLINLYLDRKFHIPEKKLGSIMSGSQLTCIPFNLLAPAVARRFGPVMTMVFAHLPAAIFLGMIPGPSSLVLTFVFIYLRSSLNTMDQAPRSAFVSAVVLAEERTAAMGLANVLKTFSQSFGPGITGVLSGRGLFWVAFVLAGSLKALYDVGLLALFEIAQLHNRKENVEADEGETHSNRGEENSAVRSSSM